jgi:hypothetical protein
LAADLGELEKSVENSDREPFRAAFGMGFVLGVWDSYDHATPKEVSLEQMCRVVAKHLREHPERLHLKADMLVRQALSDAFPLPSGKRARKPQEATMRSRTFLHVSLGVLALAAAYHLGARSAGAQGGYGPGTDTGQGPRDRSRRARGRACKRGCL